MKTTAASDPKEHRSVPRHTCCNDLQVVFDGFAPHIQVRAPDISPQGMFINTPQVFGPGAVLKVRFRLAHSGRLIHTRAEVRYCLPGVGVGVEFVEMHADDRAAIAEETSASAPDW